MSFTATFTDVGVFSISFGNIPNSARQYKCCIFLGMDAIMRCFYFLGFHRDKIGFILAGVKTKFYSQTQGNEKLKLILIDILIRYFL